MATSADVIDNLANELSIANKLLAEYRRISSVHTNIALDNTAKTLSYMHGGTAQSVDEFIAQTDILVSDC